MAAVTDSATKTTNERVLSTTVGDVDLVEYELRAGDHVWRVLHAGGIITEDDEQRFLGAERRLPYGVMLWPSSIALAHELATRPLKGLRVLELGSGTGLPGIVAASLGAHVTQTDLQETALEVARRNAERNNVTSAQIERRIADWTTWDDDGPYDLVIGADILYGTTMHDHLRAIFACCLKPSGRLLLADPLRKTGFPMFERLEAEGWKIAMNKWTIGADESTRIIGVFEAGRG